jgi:methionine synthase II (cobalamin-independent)
VAYGTSEARQELLDTIADAIEEIGAALAALGAAYEQLDEHAADELEERLFRPVQVAYGRAKRTYTGFADRHDLTVRAFEPASPGAPSHGVKGFLDNAVDSVAEADDILLELQNSLAPVEVGDAELRAGLSEVRELIGTTAARAREVVRTFGR